MVKVAHRMLLKVVLEAVQREREEGRGEGGPWNVA